MTSYAQYKDAALAGLTPSEREVYDQAYETAGIAMELAGIAYQARRSWLGSDAPRRCRHV